jgi:hypothetical protein
MKMVGDDLTITLFLISLAGSVAVGGISQAGWKNRPLIASLFVFAAVLFMAGIGWPWLKDFSPSVKPIVVASATSPVAWFVILMFGLSAALFMPRLRKDAPASVLDEMASSATAEPSQSAALPDAKQILVPVDIYPLHDPNAQGYPHKLCIAVKNESGKDLLVDPADWEKRGASDIAFRRSDYHPWIPEGPNGWERRDWMWSRSPDRATIHLPRDRAIMTWVGLHGPIYEIELRQRIVGKRLGTLIIPFTVDGESRMETIKL